MKILALERELPGAAPDAFGKLSRAEAARLWELVQGGVVRETWFRAGRSEAVLALECGTEEEASKQLASLPLVQAGLITFDLIPLAPYPGFARLFAQEVE
jgi:muconolactone delta-isomerase